MNKQTIISLAVGAIIVISGGLFIRSTIKSSTESFKIDLTEPTEILDESVCVSNQDIKKSARRSSVQVNHYIPVMKAYFTKPLEKEKSITEEEIKELIDKKLDVNELKKELDEKIDEAIKMEREFQSINMYEAYLTKFTKRGYISHSPIHIPLKAVAPTKYAKFPERVLAVSELEESDIKAYEKNNRKDIESISELANVSVSVAEKIVTKLNGYGYIIHKSEIDTSKEIKLLWFDDGWDDDMPFVLDWSVTLGDSDKNILVGYDSRGLLITSPIPKNTSVTVKASYFAMRKEYLPKTNMVKQLESEVRKLQEAIEEKEKEYNKEIDKYKKELKEYEEEKYDFKRDISMATNMDVILGVVAVERFWSMGSASGIFLGNMAVREDDVEGHQSSWMGVHSHNIGMKEKGIILTNCHVAKVGMDFTVYVTEDKEVMWIVFPGVPFVRYTKDSDLFGSPSQVLSIDYRPITSFDFDCALMTTTKVFGYEDYSVDFGNSDNVEEGEKVIMVGNPSFLQKFLTEGVISNKNYSILDSFLPIGGYASGSYYRFLKNSNFWFDTPIGIGGTSGSGVWSLEGKERGNVVALHNMGMVTPVAISSIRTKGSKVDSHILERVYKTSTLLKDIEYDTIFSGFDFRNVKFDVNVDKFMDNNKGFKDAIGKHCGGRVDVSGMNAGIPINKIKSFLQERGIDPDAFGFGKSSEKHWEK